jgi:pimeloyl-ACP methyl ester carboxylesterase
MVPSSIRRCAVVERGRHVSGRNLSPELDLGCGERGYDKATLAEDVHQLLVALGLEEHVNVVGHDIGTMVAYAYAAAHRSSTRRLVLLEAPRVDEMAYQVPAWTEAGPGLWNFGFFTLDNGLPEHMVSGREDTWVAGFVDWLEVVKGAVDSGAVAEYAAHLRRPGHLAASYAYFRTFHRDVEETIRNREKPLAMPVLAIGGEGALGQVIPDQAQRYAGDVTGAVLPCGHWVAEESPELLLKHLLPFLG